VAGAKKAVEEYGAEALIMDDGFQHRRLARDLDIVAIDATCPFGGGFVLPAGLLREPLGALKRAGAVVITRSNQVPEIQVHLIEERIRSINAGAAIARSVHVPVKVRMLKGMSLDVESLAGQNVYAFCGIGNPDGFFGMLKDMGLKLVGTRVFDDHWDYSASDMKDIHREAAGLDANIVLTTQKDWVKTALAATWEDDESLVLGYLDIRLEITEGKDRIVELIDKAVRRRKRKMGEL
jgi:tetraacyldisaccharide 4'-kinase